MDDIDRFAQELEQQCGRRDGLQVVKGMQSGLELLNGLLHSRLDEDVKRVFGEDSMLVSASQLRNALRTKTEISLYEVAESAAAIQNFRYWPAGNNACVPWLAKVVLNEPSLNDSHRQKIEGYLSRTARMRRLLFTDVLVKVLPESRRAPLILFLLFPLAVQIAAAMAFGDRTTAERLRASQIEHLSVIASCRECRGRVLENGQSCPQCGNPLWKTDRLTSLE
jgi:hypothetical protein